MGKRRVICIEGPDNVGKTTLAEQLAKEFKGAVRHWGPPPGDGEKALRHQLRILEDELNGLAHGTDQLEIWDRSVIGESVYGPLYRQYEHGKYWEQLKELKAHEKQIFLIVMYADPEFYEQFDIPIKGDEKVAYQRQEESKKVAVKFVDVAGALNLKHTLYINCFNYPVLSARNDYIMKRVRRWLNSKQFEFTKTNDYSSTFFNLRHRLWEAEKGFFENRFICGQFNRKQCAIGNDFRKLRTLVKTPVQPIGGIGGYSNLRYIFVGESSGYNDDGPQLCHPFYNGVSGCLFQSTLTSLGIHPIHYYLTNIVKCNPKGNKLDAYVNRQTRQDLECVGVLYKELVTVHKKNPDAKIVAFGKVASEELGRLGCEYQTCYHPSYFLRMGISSRFAMDLKAILTT